MTEIEATKIAKPCVSPPHGRVTREDFSVYYETNQKDDEICMCSSAMVVVNWAFESTNPKKIHLVVKVM